MFSAADLEVVVLVEGADRSPLLFWKYANALREARAAGTIFSSSRLGTYAMWREFERSIPRSDAVVVDAHRVADSVLPDLPFRHGRHSSAEWSFAEDAGLA